ncbi:MAG: thymidine phosphorylase [Candidatus Onthovivens sp.]|nr:thymidine phosphorylase [Candidatus Onthovivens sp.]MDY4936808.1 thymidine phosphorylase [Candidatus Onthovivens sp.]
MRMEEIIEHKRDGLELSQQEIHFFIKNYVDNKIPDYQASALLMAIYLKGMNDKETALLTEEMRVSGDVWDLSDIPGLKVDKHSTGGVGDKVSLVLGPMVASCGAKLAKMSGRGLGHTGGTLDKLESIPNFDIFETKEEFKKQIQEVGMAIIGQNKDIDPADKKLYALRDVTGTVSSMPLIASSIMSKKLASGADCILLDVKYGSGAFMKTKKDAKKLAEIMINIGRHLGKDVRAEVTDMDQPLGYAVGNNLEIKEVIETLHNRGPKDLTKLCLDSGSIMLVQAKLFHDKKEARKALLKNLKNGKAFEKFVEFVKAQKGDTSYILDPSKFEVAKNIIPIYSNKEGVIKRIDALTIGKSSMKLGGGRERIEDTIDMSAGIILNKKIGDFVKNNELLATLYTNKEDFEEIKLDVLNAFIF